MKYILVIRGLSETEYLQTKQDITDQFKALGYPIPVFASLPDSHTAIETVWIGEETEHEISPEVLVRQTLLEACLNALEDGEDYKLSKVVQRQLREAIRAAGGMSR